MRIERRWAPPRSLSDGAHGEDEDAATVLDDADVRAVVRRDVRRREDLGRRSLGDDRALVEQDEPLGVLAGEREVVHRRHDRQPVPAQRVDELEHELLPAEIECRRRLVEQQHRRLLRERAREHCALELAAAERAERPLGEAFELEPA